MQKYQNAIQDVHGNAVASATVTVYLYGTLTPATIYSDNGLTVIASSQVTTDSDGQFYFYADNGRYTLSVMATGFAQEQFSDVSLFDQADAGVNGLGDYGVINGNGTTNNSTTVLAADAAATLVTVPAGVYNCTTVAATDLDGPYNGYGQIKDSAGNKRGKFFAAIKAAPSALGNTASIDTAFNGDLAKCQFPVEHRITGAATLGQPTTGYVYTPEAYPYFTYVYNTSGYNQSTSSNVGRTAAVAYRTKVDNYGQGDAVAYNATAFVTGTKTGSTSFLANPAASLFNGDMTAGADGVYLNPYETALSDNGFDSAAVGLVNNFTRTVATGAKSAVWMGYRAQSNGSATCDALISGTGKWITGLDFAMSSLDFGANKAAISLKGNDRIYLNNSATASGNLAADWRTTSFNGDYIVYSSALSGMNFVIGGTSKLQVTASQVTVASSPLAVNIGSGSNSYIRSLQTGFGLPTGTTNTASFDTATVTTTQLAQYVKGLVERLHSGTSGAHHLIGA